MSFLESQSGGHSKSPPDFFQILPKKKKAISRITQRNSLSFEKLKFLMAVQSPVSRLDLQMEVNVFESSTIISGMFLDDFADFGNGFFLQIK